MKTQQQRLIAINSNEAENLAKNRLPQQTGSRRTALASLAGLTLIACGGGGGSNGFGLGAVAPEPPVATSKELSLTQYATGRGTADASLLNKNGDGYYFWKDPATNKLTQAQYRFGSSEKYRVYLGPDEELQRVVNELDGSFMVVDTPSPGRIDYNHYSANGSWQSGFSILDDGDGSYSVAEIKSDAGLSGQQITINLSGPITASLSLLPDRLSGLGVPKKIIAGGQPMILAALREQQKRPSNRLLDMLIGTAYAQNVPRENIGGAVSGALIMSMGGIALSSGAIFPAVVLGVIGAAVFGYNLVAVTAPSINWLKDAISDITGASLTNLGSGSSPLSSVSENLQLYATAGLSGLPKFPDITGLLENVTSAAQSAIESLDSNLWTPITNGLPTGDVLVSGLGIANNGDTFSATGSYSPSSGDLTFAGSNTVSGAQITGSGNVHTGVGTYTSDSGGGAQTGGAEISRTALGVCQTVQNSGGQGTFSKIYDMGKDSGTFSLSYAMQSVPDAMTVRDATGKVVFTTGGLVSGSRTVQVSYSGGRFIYVTMNAPESGTVWDYRISCPE